MLSCARVGLSGTFVMQIGRKNTEQHRHMKNAYTLPAASKNTIADQITGLDLIGACITGLDLIGA